jgi:predicted transcriptional regulator
MIELRMYKRKLKQKGVAKLMGVAEAKLSQILSAKKTGIGCSVPQGRLSKIAEWQSLPDFMPIFF